MTMILMVDFSNNCSSQDLISIDENCSYYHHQMSWIFFSICMLSFLRTSDLSKFSIDSRRVHRHLLACIWCSCQNVAREHTQLIIECNIFCIECARCTRSSFLPSSLSVSFAFFSSSSSSHFLLFFFTPLESKPIKTRRETSRVFRYYSSVQRSHTQTYYVNLSTSLYRPQNRFNFHGINIVCTFSFSILHFALRRKRPRIKELVSLFFLSS